MVSCSTDTCSESYDTSKFLFLVLSKLRELPACVALMILGCSLDCMFLLCCACKVVYQLLVVLKSNNILDN